MLLWRCQKWWTAEQAKGQTLGKRHPGRFRAGNTERSIANVLGVDWIDACPNRAGWKQLLCLWLRESDVPWARGRQGALCA